MQGTNTNNGLLSAFFAQVEAKPDKLAILDGRGGRVSFAELNAQSQAMARDLHQKGIRAGMRTLLAAPVSVELYVAMAALWRLGAVIVFPEPAMGLRGLNVAVEIAEPAAFVGVGKFALLPFISRAVRKIPLRIRPKLDHQGAVDDYPSSLDDPALISFTSGSTGLPKAIIRDHRFMLAQIDALAPIIGGAKDDDIDLVAFPVFVIAELALGQSAVLPDWPLKKHDRVKSEQITNRIARSKATRLLVPPSICASLAEGKAAGGVRTIFTGGGPVFPDLLTGLHARYPEAEIISVYGSTEAEPIAVQRLREISPENWQNMQNGKGLYAGHPIPSTAVEILNDEILVTGAHVNKSYMDTARNAGNKIERNGEIWHRTGDAGLIDQDGGLWLRGRLSAKAGSYFPFEIEIAARQMKGVEQVALVPNSAPPLLAIEGQEPSAGAWAKALAGFEGLKIISVKQIPMDRRHRSKVDYGALRNIIALK